MKPLLLNTSDSQGGAAIATYRLHHGLRAIGVNSTLLVQEKKTGDYSVVGPSTKWQRICAFFRPYVEVMASRFYKDSEATIFSPAWVPDRLSRKSVKLNPDVVHLFWINWGFMKLETLRKFQVPVIWTLHDMWPFTGGCHYDAGCGKFQQSCGDCPLLHSGREMDLSRRIWTRKKNSWNDIPIVVVATSKWLADMARSSSLFRGRRIEVIPNGIDTEVYKPISKVVARTSYNLPLDKNLILFSAFGAMSDKRKGNQYLLPALQIMSLTDMGKDTELVVIGASQPENPPDLGMKVHYIGHLHDEVSQILLYSAVDVLVAPSVQENLSNTVMESLACGTPVVAFDIGGMPDMIDHKLNGYLVKPFEPSDLAQGISWVLDSNDGYDVLSQHARQTAVERYSLKAVAGRYMEIYQSVLN